MHQLSLCRWNGTVKRRNKGKCKIIDEIRLQVAVREAHPFGQASFLHFFFAGSGTDLVETLVQEEQEGTFHETNSTKYFANLENPTNVMGVRTTFGDPCVESRSNN